MIRRGFWLAAGAVIGVTGYRKAARFGRELSWQARPASARARGVIAGAALPGLTRPGRARRSGSATAATLSRAASAAAFVRDVREGMAQYRDLQSSDFGRNLGSQSDPAAPAQARQPRREL